MTQQQYQDCNRCHRPIEWKNKDGKRSKHNPDGSGHSCKECQYCGALIEWTNPDPTKYPKGTYINMEGDRVQHQCQQYRQRAQTTAMTTTAPPPPPPTETTSPTSTSKIPVTVIVELTNVLRNIGLTLGELKMSIDANTQALQAWTQEPS